MINIEIRINNILIGYAYIRNIGQHNCGQGEGVWQNEVFDYKVEYYRPEKGLIETRVMHTRKHGAEKLIEKCFKQLYKKIQEMKKD